MREQIEARMSRLHADYVDCIDNDLLEAWPDFFTPDALYRILTRDALANDWPAGLMHCEGRGMLHDRILSLRRANIYEPHGYRHLISSIRYKGEVDGGWAVLSKMLDAGRVGAAAEMAGVGTGADGSREPHRTARRARASWGCHPERPCRARRDPRRVSGRSLVESMMLSSSLAERRE